MKCALYCEAEDPEIYRDELKRVLSKLMKKKKLHYVVMSIRMPFSSMAHSVLNELRAYYQCPLNVLVLASDDVPPDEWPLLISCYHIAHSDSEDTIRQWFLRLADTVIICGKPVSAEGRRFRLRAKLHRGVKVITLSPSSKSSRR